MVQAKAIARYTPIAVRKARVVVNLVRGMPAAEALEALRFTRKSAAPVVAKVLDSAIANARDQHEDLDVETLYVTEAYANEAPTQMRRRWRPRAQGRATRVIKGSSHITIVLGQREN